MENNYQLTEDVREELLDALDERFENRLENYNWEVNSHFAGPTIDITKDGNNVSKVGAAFAEVAMECGYIVTATNVHDGTRTTDEHTRVFLQDVGEYFDLEQPTFVAAGFGYSDGDYDNYADQYTDRDGVYGTVADGRAVAFAVEGSDGAEYLQSFLHTHTIAPNNEYANEYDDCLEEYRSEAQ